MTSHSKRKTSGLVPGMSRNSSHARRADLALASTSTSTPDALALARLLQWHRAKAQGDPKGGARLRSYEHHLRKAGRVALVAETNRALYADGGRLLRLLSQVDDETALAAAHLFVTVRRERDVTAADASALLFRACVASVIADRTLARVAAGTATPDEAKTLDRMSASARLDLLTSLQLQARVEVQGDDASNPIMVKLAAIRAEQDRQQAEQARQRAITAKTDEHSGDEPRRASEASSDEP